MRPVFHRKAAAVDTEEHFLVDQRRFAGAGGAQDRAFAGLVRRAVRMAVVDQVVQRLADDLRRLGESQQTNWSVSGNHSKLPMPPASCAMRSRSALAVCSVTSTPCTKTPVTAPDGSRIG